MTCFSRAAFFFLFLFFRHPQQFFQGGVARQNSPHSILLYAQRLLVRIMFHFMLSHAVMDHRP